MLKDLPTTLFGDSPVKHHEIVEALRPLRASTEAARCPDTASLDETAASGRTSGGVHG
jgi:hypothetical protein